MNGDALQIYKGLPISTNKISEAERGNIPHHLLGCLSLAEEPWTVRQYRERASDVLQDIRSRGKIPILVGGTPYYIQSLVLPNNLINSGKSEFLSTREQCSKWPILNAPTEEILEELRRVDPALAARWHPKDRRKVRRSLEIWLQTGRTASQIYCDQRSDARAVGEVPISDSTLSNDPLIFWTHAPPEQLVPRLNRRVDVMVSQGLLDEVSSMYDLAEAQIKEGIHPDKSRGIWIAIGYKEFLPYMKDKYRSESIRQECIERTKIATRQYSKRQSRWIQLKLFPAMQNLGLGRNMFMLDTSDLPNGPSNTEVVALDITKSFLSGDLLPSPEFLSDLARSTLTMKDKDERSARYCDACDKTLMTETEWLLHLKSKGHRGATRPKVDWSALYPKDGSPRSTRIH